MSKEYVPAKLRRQVIERARGCCEYCLVPARFVPDSFTVEHVVPVCKGGPTVLENLALACSGCNGHKSAKTEGLDPLTGICGPLFHPRQQRWDEHFAWNDDLTQVVGLTPTGRITIQELDLNRPSLINLRGALRVIGQHPPPELTSPGGNGFTNLP